MTNSINLYIANLGKYNEGELVGKWISLPITDEEFKAVLKEIKIDGIRYEEYAIHDYECEFMNVDEYDDIDKLNELAETLEGMNESDENKLKAIIEFGYYQTAAEAIENLDDFNLLEEVTNDEILGYYYFDELGLEEQLGNLVYYFDYEKYGRDIRLESVGFFSTYGWLEKR